MREEEGRAGEGTLVMHVTALLPLISVVVR
jgi:hypothetical protein